ncbi:MAG: Asp-tRNA(Asn)/Glu-tRNA(Gln) amidotransferase subunit GatA [Clostridiaceae bacterium]|nr:Asp-tRNA(Asn)/Glu-tRNA(Gln) amidotransferase subunit GatA [Clostridiaceae bacterium]
MTAYDLQRGITEKQFTAKEVITSFFQRIDEKEPLIDGFLTLCREEALARAEQIDEKIRRGEQLGRLAGVPIAIKDNICTDGIKTTCASRILYDFIPPYDATVIKKLKEADAVIIGKTNMDEFAMGSSTENSAFKKTKNPWDRERVPGGSSGGSAAVVSAGMAAFALGSDTGGSIRQPAAFCGVVGLKPTYGLVSRFGLVAFGSSLDQIGPLAKNVKDCALALEAIQGEDRLDSTSVKDTIKEDYISSINDGVKGMKIAVPVEFFQSGLDEEIAASIKESIEKFKALGAVVEEISLPITEEGLSAYYIISSAEASSNLARFDGIRYGYRTEEFKDLDELMEKSRSEGFGEEVKRRIMLGTFALSSGYYDAYYNRAQKLRKKIKEQFTEAFKSYDIILSPVSPVLPFKIGEKSSDPIEMYLADIYTININLAGVPAMSMPCGVSKAGLPIGLQIIGPHYGEDRIFRAAYALEQEDTLAGRDKK